MVRAVIVRQGDKYPECYTRVLKKQFAEQGIDALVLGDGPDADIELGYPFLEGWWSKLELFSDELKDYRPFLYLDLDSLVLGPILEMPMDKFLMCREWHPQKDRWNGECQSSMMVIPKETSHIWNAITPETLEIRGGDQAWLCQFREGFIQDLYPDLIGSYRFGNKLQRVHNVVTFHGRPKPKDADGWAGEVWKAYNT